MNNVSRYLQEISKRNSSGGNVVKEMHAFNRLHSRADEAEGRIAKLKDVIADTPETEKQSKSLTEIRIARNWGTTVKAVPYM